MTDSPVAVRTKAKISRRLMPFLLVLFLLAFIDRSNVAVAALDMKKDLGFTDDIIGTGAGIFFIGYFLLEIPGTLIVERWSARKWIARIMITWGIVATLMGFIGLPLLGSSDPKSQFYWLRFTLGLAEAGFFPGVIVYLSHWFRYQDRARTKSLFLIGIPLATIIATPLSQWIMTSFTWLGLSGWRWVYILEGIPSVIMGFATWWYLTDRPEEAKWLEPEEREWIQAELAREKAEKMQLSGDTIGAALRSGQTWLLATIYLLAVTGMYGFTFFLPAINDQLVGASVATKTLVTTIPYVLGLFAILWNGKHSDRTLERRWHTAIPLLGGGLMMGLAAFFAASPAVSAGFMCLLGLTLYAYIPVFWTHPTARLAGASAAFAVGLINSVGNLGGFFGPKLMGAIKTSTNSFTGGLWFLTVCLLLAGGLATFLTPPKGKPDGGGA